MAKERATQASIDRFVVWHLLRGNPPAYIVVQAQNKFAGNVVNRVRASIAYWQSVRQAAQTAQQAGRDARINPTDLPHKGRRAKSVRVTMEITYVDPNTGQRKKYYLTTDFTGDNWTLRKIREHMRQSLIDTLTEHYKLRQGRAREALVSSIRTAKVVGIEGVP